MANHKQENTMTDVELLNKTRSIFTSAGLRASLHPAHVRDILDLTDRLEAANQRIEGLERELSAERNASANAEAKVAAVEKEARSLVADFDGWADAGRRILKVLNALCEHEMPIGSCINCATQSPEPAAASAPEVGCQYCDTEDECKAAKMCLGSTGSPVR